MTASGQARRGNKHEEKRRNFTARESRELAAIPRNGWEEGKELNHASGRQGLQGGEHAETGRGVGCWRRHLRAIRITWMSRTTKTTTCPLTRRITCATPHAISLRSESLYF